MKSFASLLTVLALLVAVPAAAATYTNGIDANYPPFAFVDKEGKPAGFDVESMDWIAKKMGFEVKHQPMDWDGIVPAVLAKKIDMVCSGMSITPERAAQVNFTDPYYQVSKIIMVKQDGTMTVDQALNSPIKLGVQRGTNEHTLLENMQAEQKLPFTLRFYDSAPMAVEDLLNGRVEALAMDNAPAEDAIRKGKAVKIVGSFGPVDDFGVAVHKENAELMKILNEGYKLLMADPFWTELQEKHLK